MQTQDVTPEFFIKPGVDLAYGSEDYRVMVKLPKKRLQERWETPQGRQIWERWKANAFERSVLESLVGGYYDHLDLRGLDLSGKDLSGADISKVDFYAANMENAILQNANFSNSYLSEVNIKGTCFNWAKMDEVLIDNVAFNNQTSFIGVRLSKIDFNLSEQLEDFAYSQQRIASLERRYPRLSKVLKVTCDYGRSFPLFFTWCGAIIFVFGLFYFLIPGTLNQSGLGNSLYFSFLSFVGLGSDIQPASILGKLLLVIQSALGYLMTGLLIAIFVKRTIGD